MASHEQRACDVVQARMSRVLEFGRPAMGAATLLARPPCLTKRETGLGLVAGLSQCKYKRWPNKFIAQAVYNSTGLGTF